MHEIREWLGISQCIKLDVSAQFAILEFMVRARSSHVASFALYTEGAWHVKTYFAMGVGRCLCGGLAAAAMSSVHCEYLQFFSIVFALSW